MYKDFYKQYFPFWEVLTEEDKKYLCKNTTEEYFEKEQSVRRNKDGEEAVIYTDWYLERDFSDAELRLIIDSLLFSKHIPYSRCKELIEKIEGLSNRYFKSKVRHIRNLPVDQPQNAELFYTIEILDEAIERNRQVVFHYGDYGTDKKLHLRERKDGKPREYLVKSNYDSHKKCF